MTDFDPDEAHLAGGEAQAMPPGPSPEGFLPADRVGVTPLAFHARSPTSQVAPSDRNEGGPFLDTPGVPPVTKLAAWRWLFYALVGFLVGQLAGALFGIVSGEVAGKSAAQMSAITSASEPPEWYVLSTLAGIWVGFVGAPWLASWTQGTRHFLTDLGVRFRWVDLWGIAVGVGGQYAIDLLYWPFQHDIHNFNAPGQKLTAGAHGAGIILLVLATAVIVPFAEELFFRGLLFKALVRLCTPLGPGTTRARGVGVAAAVVVDGLLFGLAHGEWLQLAGLALFGIVLAAVSYRTGRLGMNMVAHAAFNLVAVLTILHQRGGVIH